MSHSSLRLTLKALGSCAKKIAQKTPVPVTPDYLEFQIGVGTCGDWVAWGSRLRGLDFSSSIKRGSPRSRSYLESTRFTYVWTAANALFARDKVIGRLASVSGLKTELPRFKVLYSAAAMLPSQESALLKTLHGVLDTPRTPTQFPWIIKHPVRVIDLIHYKYTPDTYKKRGAISDVANGVQPVTSLDLPTIIYAARNWTVHGTLLNSSFRGSPEQFLEFITAVTEGVSLVLRGAAMALEKTL